MTPTPQPQEDLLPCPMCGCDLFIRRGVNPYGRCDTIGCWTNARAVTVPLDDPKQVAAWNTRAKPSTREAEAPVSEAVDVWVLTASQGEYSDRSEWTVSVHSNEAEARAEVERLDGEDRLTRKRGYDATAHYLSGPFKLTAPSPASAWKPIDADTPTDRMIIAMCRYPDATAGSPSFVRWDGEFGWEYSKNAPEKVVCWAWMERDVLGAWPSEPTPPVTEGVGE